MYLRTPPDILLCILKRHIVHGGESIIDNRDVVVENELGELGTDAAKYDLHGGCIHSGADNQGHFVSVVKTTTGGHHFDDRNVRRISCEQALRALPVPRRGEVGESHNYPKLGPIAFPD